MTLLTTMSLVGRGGDGDEGGDGSVVLMAEHVDLGVGVVTYEDEITDRELSHGLLQAGLELNGGG